MVMTPPTTMLRAGLPGKAITRQKELKHLFAVF